MATVQVNGLSCVQKIMNAKSSSLHNAAQYISEDIPFELSKSAKKHGSSALRNFFVYDADADVKDGATGIIEDNVITVKVRYNQDALVPGVGEDTEEWRHTSPKWRHTSPIGDDPYNYMALVNSGNSGYLFSHYPAWAGNSGYWDEVMENIPKIVGKALHKAKLIFKY